MSKVNERIIKQERKDRSIVELALPRIFNNDVTNILILSTPLYCHVDLKCKADYKGKTFDFNVEIKEFNKVYDNVLLKEDKLNYILLTEKHPTLYIIIENPTLKMYVFYLNTINWNKILKCSMRLKSCLYCDSYYWVEKMMYYIPKKIAKKELDISDIYKNYIQL